MNHGARKSQAMDLSGGEGPNLAFEESTHSHQFGQFVETLGSFASNRLFMAAKKFRFSRAVSRL